MVKFRQKKTENKGKKFYITTAIAYPNSTPHLGHALEIIQADAAVRFYRLEGGDVFFQTGTDEHGNKNWQTAKKEGKEIMEFLDENVASFRELYKKLNVSYDNFIRTTDKKLHYEGARKLWNELVKAGDIYRKKYKGMYCTGCEAFKTPKELIKGKCENHPAREIEEVEEENYFFRLSKYKEEIIKKIKNDEYVILPNSRKNEILSFLRNVKDISFSRPKSILPWGIPVPDDKEQIMYVWCDALSNYITGVGYGTDEKKFKDYWPADIHIIGKDILRFHAAFWPAMLLSAKLELPKKLFVHGFILSKGAKMSKSTGNVIEPFEQIKKYGADQFRFCILEAMPLDGDGEYSEDIVIERINNELASNIGNFCYRTISFANRNFDGEVKEIDNNGPVIKEINDKIEKIENNYYNFNFKEVIKDILHISSVGNKYFQNNEPWKLVKEDKEKTHKIIGLCINIIKNLSILLSPILPDFSNKIQAQLNLKDLKWSDINFGLKNHKINKEEILFRKIKEQKISNPPENVRFFDKRFQLNLKVAKILDVKDHPNADKLYVMQIDLGNEKRQLVAGIRDNYSKEELKNKKIIVVANLKHAKLRGIESQGMLLAGDDGKNIGLLTAKNSGVGDKVFFEGYENSKEEITFENFLKIDMTVKNNKVIFENKELKTDKEVVIVEKVKNGARVR